MSPGVLPFNPILVTCRGFLLIHAPPYAVSTKKSFIAGVKSVHGATRIGTILLSIPGFIAGGKIGMVRLLINLCSKIPLLVLVNCFIPVASVSNCLLIARKITLCVTRGLCV